MRIYEKEEWKEKIQINDRGDFTVLRDAPSELF